MRCIVSVVAVATVLFLLLIGSAFGLRFFPLEAGTGQRLAADDIEQVVDASVKAIAFCPLPPVPGNLVGNRQRPPKY